MKAICQLCNEVYAIVSLETLKYPLTGAMFGSPDPVHGVPAPFDPSLTWEFFRCPYGRIHRPMVQDDAMLTDQGLVRLPKDGSPAYLTAETGEVDRHSIGDRVLQVSDEEAERQVRAHVKAAEGQVSKVLMDAMLTHDEFVLTADRGLVRVTNKVYPCPTCDKIFPTEKQMKGHIGGAHKQGKKKGRRGRK